VEPVGATSTSITITQDASALKMDVPMYSITLSFPARDATPAPPSGPTSVRHLVYRLDGSESVQPVPDPSPAPSYVNPRSVMSGHLIKSVARASWMNGQLVIVTHTTERMTAPNQVPAEVDLQRTMWQKLSLNSDGRLVVDRVIIADPVPWATKLPAEPPASVRFIYKKTSS
jgi:hypothetical protein